MRTVYKYKLELKDGVQEISMPIGAKVLFFTMQKETPTIWAEVNTEMKGSQIRAFIIHGTGHPIGPNENYVGTTFDRVFVWHLYEITNNKSKPEEAPALEGLGALFG